MVLCEGGSSGQCGRRATTAAVSVVCSDEQYAFVTTATTATAATTACMFTTYSMNTMR